MPGFFTERNALHREAKMWAFEPPAGQAAGEKPRTIFTGDIEGRSMAEVAGSCAGAAEALALTPQEFSLAAVETGLRDTYDALRVKVDQLLQEAKSNFESISDVLIAISVEYGRADEEADEELRRLWVPKPREENEGGGVHEGR